MVYVTPVALAHALSGEAAAVQVAPDVGAAITVRPSIRPRATKILIIFLTSFLLSYDQALPDFEAAWFFAVIATIWRLLRPSTI
jgi:hypothetical protein